MCHKSKEGSEELMQQHETQLRKLLFFFFLSSRFERKKRKAERLCRGRKVRERKLQHGASSCTHPKDASIQHTAQHTHITQLLVFSALLPPPTNEAPHCSTVAHLFALTPRCCLTMYFARCRPTYFVGDQVTGNIYLASFSVSYFGLFLLLNIP